MKIRNFRYNNIPLKADKKNHIDKARQKKRSYKLEVPKRHRSKYSLQRNTFIKKRKDHHKIQVLSNKKQPDKPA